jgi:predicted permease
MNFSASIPGALVPIFIVILSGYAFRMVRFPGDDFWSYAERITYFVLFPALLLQKTATASLDLEAFMPMVAALYAAILAMAGLVFLLRPWRAYGLKAFTSFFQGSIRFNTYVGLSAALALFGNEGLTLAAVTIAVLIPFINVLCVTVLVACDDSPGRNWRTVLVGIGRNPMILSCLAGLALNVSGIGLHSLISDTLSLFGRASLPLGLLVLGAGLDIGAVRADRNVIAFNCVLKLLALPAFMWAASQVMAISPIATAIAVLFAALPGAPTSYILARQHGGDSRLMANIVTVQVMVSMLTLPAVMAMINV